MTFRTLTILLLGSTIFVVAMVWCILPLGARRGAARELVASQGRGVVRLASGSPKNAGQEVVDGYLTNAYAEENRELRRALGLAERNPHFLVAEVISRGGIDGWSQRIRIGKGTNEGIESNAPVLVQEGLVGHVVEVTRSTADVLLLSDLNSHVACEVEDASGAIIRGILSGTGPVTPWNVAPDGVSAPLRLDYLNRHSSPAAGAVVKTSGLGGIYPKGLPVGVVDALTVDTSGYYRRAVATPLASLDTVRWVFVLSGWEGRHE